MISKLLIIFYILYHLTNGIESSKEKSSDFRLGACKNVKVFPGIKMEMFIVGMAGSYVNIASKHYVLSTTEAFSDGGLENLENICVRVFGLPEITVIQSFGKKVNLKCENVKENILGDSQCKKVDKDSTSQKYPEPRFTMAWTDNKNHIISVRCLDKKYADWYVLSTEPNLLEGEKKIILAEVKKLGFPIEPKDFVEMQYGKCPKAKFD